MAEIDWPEGLTMLSGTLSEGSVDPWISDASEVGAPRRRKRFTRALLGFTFELRLSSQDRAALLSFYDDVLEDGVQIFNWTHPWTQEAFEVRFASRPVVDHKFNRYWSAQVSLEQV